MTSILQIAYCKGEMSTKKRVLLFLRFVDSELVECYHSSKYIDDNSGYAVLGPPFENLYKSIWDNNNYATLHFIIHTNDVERSIKIYTDYVTYVEEKISKIEVVLKYTFNLEMRENPDIVKCLTEFNS